MKTYRITHLQHKKYRITHVRGKENICSSSKQKIAEKRLAMRRKVPKKTASTGIQRLSSLNQKAPERSALMQIIDVQKTRPPFPVMPSKIVAVTMLSYYDYDIKVSCLLKILCKNTHRWSMQDAGQIQAFVYKWSPKIYQQIDIGRQEFDLNEQYPRPEEVAQWPMREGTKISSLSL